MDSECVRDTFAVKEAGGYTGYVKDIMGSQQQDIQPRHHDRSDQVGIGGKIKKPCMYDSL